MSTRKTEAASTAQKAANEAKRVAESARETVDQGLSAVRSKAGAAEREVEKAVRAGTAQTARLVQDNPALAIAAATGFGLLIGLALRNRH